MWRIVFIFCQMAVCVISENVANPSTIANPNINSNGEQSTEAPQLYRIPLKNFGNLDYTGSIYIGGPEPQEVRVTFDTGSDDIVVPIVHCPDLNRVCRTKGSFDPMLSQSYVKLAEKQDVIVPYAERDVTTSVSEDNITMAGLTIGGQTFGVSLNMVQNPKSELYQGLFGLGFGNMSDLDHDKKRLMVRLKEENKIEKGVFCFHLNTATTNTDQVQNDGSVLIIGGCDVQAQHYEPVLPNPVYWKIKTTIKVNNNEVICENGCEAILDTGASITRGPLPFISQLNGFLGAELVDGSFFFQKPDSELESFPNITVKFGKFEINLTRFDYVGAIEIEGTVVLYSLFQPHRRTVGTVEMNFFLFGLNILRQFISIFDMENNQVGFAQRPN